MPKRNLENARSTVISIRLKPVEAERFREIEEAVAVRHPYIDRADIIRELLGLVPCRAITVSELNYFRTGERITKLKSTTLAVAKALPAKKRTSKGNTQRN